MTHGTYALQGGYNRGMKASQKRLLVAMIVMFAVALTAWLWLPPAVDLLPGQLRARLPDEFLALVTTPLPAALPAPLKTAGAPLQGGPIEIAETAIATATPQPTIAEESLVNAPFSAGVGSDDSLAATQTPEPTHIATPTPRPLPPAVRLTGLEVIAQQYNNCGPANLTMVLSHYGVAVDQAAIGQALKPNYEDRNVSPDELVRYVHEESALEAVMLHGIGLETLKQLLAGGFPVIVEKGLDLGPPHGWMGHYLTLVGYDEVAGVFFGLDTFLGPWDSSGRSFEFAPLESLWAEFNRVAIVVYTSARAHEVALALGEELLDPHAMWLMAVGRAREALASDPEDAFAWFDLGASLYHLGVIRGDDGMVEQSATAFDRAREIGLPWRTLWYQFEPYLAYIAAGRFDEVLALTEAVMTTSGGRNIEETLLFRGHALLANGNRRGAEQAYERALRLNPGLAAARDALDTLEASAG
jgi:tetratricopeptide (TPR) repeat protein